MNKKNNNLSGIGLEAEAFITKEGKGIALINGLPASEFILNKAPTLLRPSLSLEQGSSMLEIKTVIPHTTSEEAVAHILQVREDLDHMLRDLGIELKFIPVLTEAAPFHPATSDPNSRTHELLKRWGDSKMQDTVTASLQINDSRPFDGIEPKIIDPTISISPEIQARLEVGRRIFNIFGQHFPHLNIQFNGKIVDQKGESRIDKASRLLIDVTKDQFIQAGLEAHSMFFPPFFPDIQSHIHWFKTCSGVDSFEQTNPKDEHAITIKLKRPTQTDISSPWIAETRLFDAVDSEEEMLKRLKVNEQLLAKINDK